MTMKRVNNFLVFVMFVFYAQFVYADYSPKNTHLVCGKYYIVLKTTLVQRLKNKFSGSEYSVTMFDLVDSSQDKFIENLVPSNETFAFIDVIPLYDERFKYKLNRITGELVILDFTQDTAFSEAFYSLKCMGVNAQSTKPECDKSPKEKIQCDIVSKSEQIGLIKNLNEKYETTKF